MRWVQDLNRVQLTLLINICRNGNLFCVGDPNQSIYAFRFAVPRIFSCFMQHFKELGKHVEIKNLDENFRSTKQILKTTNKLISNNEETFGQQLISSRSGPTPTLNIVSNKEDQFNIVKEKIDYLKNIHEDFDMSRVCILARNRYHYKSIKNRFFSEHIPFEDIVEIVSIVKKSEIKNLLSWIGMGFWEDTKKLYTCIKRICKLSIGVGIPTLEKIGAVKDGNFIFSKMSSDINSRLARLTGKIERIKEISNDEKLSEYEKVKRIVEESGIKDFYKKKNESCIETIESFVERVKNDKNFLDTVLRGENIEVGEDNERRVIFSTIHGVKGREYDHVFVVSLSKGNLPSRVGLSLCANEEKQKEYIEEERRLFYVACTRAIKTLHLLVNKGNENKSMFVDEIKSTVDLERNDSSLLVKDTIEEIKEEQKDYVEENNRIDDEFNQDSEASIET